MGWTRPLALERVARRFQRATFEQDPAVANRDPYGLGWLVRLAPSNLEDERPLLVDGPTAFGHYKQLVDAEGIRCFRCEE
jgi:glycine cleavage system H protein